jgi:dihydroflavonol-4-reductase
MVFVTGATGLLGSHLLYALLLKGKEVRALARNRASIKKVKKVFSFYTDEPDQLLNKITWVFGDVLDKSFLEKSISGSLEVYHCAAIVSFDPGDFKRLKEVNIQGTRNIIHACKLHTVKKLLHVSSVAAVGKSTDGKEITEENGFPCRALSGYSLTKTESEKIVWKAISEGVNAVIVNPSIILGPGDWYSGSGKLFSTVYSGLKFYTKGVTGFVDIRDVVEIMIRLMASEISSERFIINAENLSYHDLFRRIASGLGTKAPFIYASPLVTSIGWRLGSFFSLFTGKQPILTKNSARSSHSLQRYTSQKLLERIDYTFIPIESSLHFCTACFLKDVDLTNRAE